MGRLYTRNELSAPAEAAESWGIVRTWNQKHKRTITNKDKRAKTSNNLLKMDLPKTSKIENVKSFCEDTQ